MPTSIKELLSDQMNHEIFNFLQKIKIYCDTGYQAINEQARLKEVDQTVDRIGDIVFLYQNLLDIQYFEKNIELIRQIYHTNITHVNIKENLNKNIFKVMMIYIIWISKHYSLSIECNDNSAILNIISNPEYIHYYFKSDSLYCNFIQIMKKINKLTSIAINDNTLIINKS